MDKVINRAPVIALFALSICVASVVTFGADRSPESTVFPANFRTQAIQTDGATIHARVGGQGPAIVLLHGFGDTGDMWAPLAEVLMARHTVVVPDLRGMGLSSHPP